MSESVTPMLLHCKMMVCFSSIARLMDRCLMLSGYQTLSFRDLIKLRTIFTNLVVIDT